MELINKYYDKLNKLLRSNGENFLNNHVKQNQHDKLLNKYHNLLDDNDKEIINNHMNEINEEVKKINNDIENLKDLINDLEDFFNIEHDDDRMKAIFHGDVNDEDNESEYNSSYEETEVDVNESDGEEDDRLTINERTQIEWQIRMQDMKRAEELHNANNIKNNTKNNSDNITNSEKIEEANEENNSEIEEGTSPAKNPSIMTMENLIKYYINEFYEKTTSRQDKILRSDLTKEFNNYLKSKNYLNKKSFNTAN